VQWGIDLRSKEVISQGEALIDAVESFTDDLPTVSEANVVGTDRIITKLDTLAKGISKAPGSTKISGGENDVYRSKQLLGGFAIVETAPKASADNFTGNYNIDDLDAANREKVQSIAKRLHSLDRARASLQPFSIDLPYAVDFTTLSHKDIEAILDFATEVLEQIEKFTMKGGAAKLTEVSERLKTASKRCASDWDNYASSGESKIHAADNANVNAFLSVDLIFTRWTKEPVTALLDEALKVTRAVLMVVGKSINQYERE
jgi:hypothetical protein